jgi:hypothetical protein
MLASAVLLNARLHACMEAAFLSLCQLYNRTYFALPQAFTAALAALGTDFDTLAQDLTLLRAILNYHVTPTVISSASALASTTSIRTALGSGRVIRVDAR